MAYWPPTFSLSLVQGTQRSSTISVMPQDWFQREHKCMSRLDGEVLQQPLIYYIVALGFSYGGMSTRASHN